MKVLVTGGAGYVGSACVRRLVSEGHDVVVLDDLSQGKRAALAKGAELIVGDIRDEALVEGLFARRDFDAVMHLAAESLVEPSMRDPGRCFRVNVGGGLSLLDAMVRHGVGRAVFSSTASVYGAPEATLISEDMLEHPVNPYGESKLQFERILAWYGRAHDLKHVSFRYFNAAGAIGEVGEDHAPETHLIPNVLRAALAGKPVTIFGDDYQTTDGTCIRDYVHVDDIAAAHVLALDRLHDLPESVFNLGLGRGYSNMEVVAAAKQVSGIDFFVQVGPRRAGDPAMLIADPRRARAALGWTPRFTRLEDIVDTAWQWHKRHPHGYEASH